MIPALTDLDILYTVGKLLSYRSLIAHQTRDWITLCHFIGKMRPKRLFLAKWMAALH
jgi:hypothetical protein